MGGFEERLRSNLSLALFVPGVVYLADAVGTQTETLIIRGLSIGVWIREVVMRELMTGVLAGLIVGGCSSRSGCSSGVTLPWSPPWLQHARPRMSSRTCCRSSSTSVSRC